MTDQFTKTIRATHSLGLAFLMTVGSMANSGDGIISQQATAHISCYASLDVIVEGNEESFPELNKKRLAHEQRYISTGLSDLNGSKGSFVRNGALYRLGKYAEYRENRQRQMIYCDNPDQFNQCLRMVSTDIKQIDRIAMKFYKRANCELLLK
jgi:hypothetical protein